MAFGQLCFAFETVVDVWSSPPLAREWLEANKFKDRINLDGYTMALMVTQFTHVKLINQCLA
jgi:hypothetical protein